MKEFIMHLTEHNYQNRTIGLMGNGSWAPTAAKVMRSMFEKSKNMNFAETEVEIMSAVNEQSIAKIKELAKELA